jgi:hypothetical protein
MLERTQRSLNDSERRVLRGALGFRRKQLRPSAWRGVVVSLVIFGSLCLATLLASDAPRWFVITFWSVLGIAISLWVSISVRRELSAELGAGLKALEDAVARDQADIVRIQSSAMVEFEEIEDEGACYAFQVDERRIVFVSGQEFYPSAKFPNTDFSLVELRDARGKLIEMLIAKHGAKAVPVRKIPAATKSKLAVPDHLETIEGRLADLETLLAA